MGTKNIDDNTYFWGHIGTILFHVILAGLLIYSSYQKKTFGLENRKFVMYCGVLLLIISLLAMIPIFKYKDDDIIIS